MPEAGDGRDDDGCLLHLAAMGEIVRRFPAGSIGPNRLGEHRNDAGRFNETRGPTEGRIKSDPLTPSSETAGFGTRA